jgi:hypothetical protein
MVLYTCSYLLPLRDVSTVERGAADGGGRDTRGRSQFGGGRTPTGPGGRAAMPSGVDPSNGSGSPGAKGAGAERRSTSVTRRTSGPNREQGRGKISAVRAPQGRHHSSIAANRRPRSRSFGPGSGPVKDTSHARERTIVTELAKMRAALQARYNQLGPDELIEVLAHTESDPDAIRHKIAQRISVLLCGPSQNCKRKGCRRSGVCQRKKLAI